MNLVMNLAMTWAASFARWRAGGHRLALILEAGFSATTPPPSTAPYRNAPARCAAQKFGEPPAIPRDAKLSFRCDWRNRSNTNGHHPAPAIPHACWKPRGRLTRCHNDRFDRFGIKAWRGGIKCGGKRRGCGMTQPLRPIRHGSFHKLVKQRHGESGVAVFWAVNHSFFYQAVAQRRQRIL